MGVGSSTPQKLDRLKSELREKLAQKKRAQKPLDLDAFHRSKAYQEVR